MGRDGLRRSGAGRADGRADRKVGHAPLSIPNGIRAWPDNAGARYLAGQAALKMGDPKDPETFIGPMILSELLSFGLGLRADRPALSTEPALDLGDLQRGVSRSADRVDDQLRRL